jgi:hypothetical protein
MNLIPEGMKPRRLTGRSLVNEPSIRPTASNRFKLIGRLGAAPGGWVIIFQGGICSNAEPRVKLEMTGLRRE